MFRREEQIPYLGNLEQTTFKVH